ncbi:MAG: uracil-DNA glycosylase family protein [Bacteroidota bacterium]
MKSLLNEIRACEVCTSHLALGPRPIVEGHPQSRLLIIGQAPGRKVHESGIPWDDASGKNLRAWLGISADTFYDVEQVALLPMGFCFPGTGKSGDLPPRPECAPLWHERLLDQMKEVRLILLIGKYAQDYYLKKKAQKNLTETVKQYRSYLPKYFPLPHPSPRNNIWQKKNPWFKEALIPTLQTRVQEALAHN